MAIEWRDTPTGYSAVGYRIRRFDTARQPWQLEAAPYRVSSRPGAGIGVSSHDTVQDAMRWAVRLDAERRRRARIRGHLIAGALATAVFAVTGSLVQGIPLYATAVMSCFVALRSFVNAIALAVGDVWNWTRDGGVARAASRTDRFLERWISALEGPPQWTQAEAAASSSVTVVPAAEPHPLVRGQKTKHRRRRNST